MLAVVDRWFKTHVLDLGRELRWSYLPPLMIYLAAGASELTEIVGTFYVKEYLDVSPAFLAGLAFWVGIPWALKMPLGHLVDLIWRFKALLVWIGAAVIAASMLIMFGLIVEQDRMGAVMEPRTWFVVSSLIGPVGYALQDVVADAMTVEAVPRVDTIGQPFSAEAQRLMNTTLQALGRMADIIGGLGVALLNVLIFEGAGALSQAAKGAVYANVYLLAMTIPLLSIVGVVLARILRWREGQRLRAHGFDEARLRALGQPPGGPASPDWWILGGSTLFVAIGLVVGLSRSPFGQELIFVGSFAVIVLLIAKLMRALDAEARRTLLGTSIIVFVFRATPDPGMGQTWWMIDALGFDAGFMARLSLIGSVLALFGLLAFRRLIGERSIAYTVGFVTVVGTVLALPVVGMYYGLHEWTAAHTGGFVDARFIAVADTAFDSPLSQIAMVPMLAWIANSAPARLKATYFAVMSSFSNLALSASQLATKYLNQLFEVSREVRDPLTAQLATPANYDQLGWLLIITVTLGLLMPFMAIWLTRAFGLRCA